ncbi:hypothetical protein [Vagococcus sp.]|uniref:hypothetical protein n=1 Tax=Vagococcus sp. TaxID=1933889 RepID=UPI003F9C3132
MKEKLRSLSYFLLLILVSAIIGYLLGKSGRVTSLTMEDLLWFILFGGVSFILHLFIHEAGHAFFGKISGYDLLSFRVFSLIFVRSQETKWILKKEKVPGTLGQCIMVPPLREKFHFKLYLLGGGVANILLSFFALILFPTSPFSWSFFLLGSLFCFINLIPMGFNDGKTLQLALKNPENAYKLWIQLDVVQRMNRGETYQELPEDYFKFKQAPSKNKKTYLDDYLDFLSLGLFLEQNDWDRADEIISRKWEDLSFLILPYQLELKKQAYYVWGYLDKNEKEVANLKNEQTFQRYIKESKAENILIKAVLVWRQDKDQVTALEQLDLAESLLGKENGLVEQKLICEKIEWFRNEIVNEMIN